MKGGSEGEGSEGVVKCSEGERVKREGIERGDGGVNGSEEE